MHAHENCAHFFEGLEDGIEVPARILDGREGCYPNDPYVEAERNYYLLDIERILSQVSSLIREGSSYN